MRPWLFLERFPLHIIFPPPLPRLIKGILGDESGYSRKNVVNEHRKSSRAWFINNLGLTWKIKPFLGLLFFVFFFFYIRILFPVALETSLVRGMLGVV